MNTKQRKYMNAAMVFLTTLLLLPVSRGFSQEKSVLATTKITLKGNAKGGILTLVIIPHRHCFYVSISTEPGESSESVARRLADIINNSNPFKWGGGTFEVIVKDSSFTLLGQPGSYAFAGTEKGLGIPEPPTSLSGMYDVENEQIILNWQNPASGFDRICIAEYAFPWPTYSMITGSEEKYVYQLKDKKINSTYFFVIGIRDGIPSSPAAIRLTVNAQEELFGIPFYNGVAPNWTAWFLGNDDKVMRYEQANTGRVKKDIRYGWRPIHKPEDKPFFQIIKTRSPSVTGGVCRKFLGLKPGRTYRLYTRMNTFKMDSVQANWSFSFHAVPHGKAVTLSSEQMAGTAPLPNGSAGVLAGQVVSYGPGSTTKGLFAERSTEKSGPNSQVLDVTLPPGAEVITVWFRYSGPSSSSGVGFDWIKLRDITTK
ncbi:MAG: hypothetical protein ACYTA5_16950 [Planctomycetota bacterium]|jgi:hypothetical protein